MSDIQRTYARKSVDLDLNVTFRILGDANLLKIIKILDISYGGLRILSAQKLESDTDITVTILLDDYKLRFIAQVKRSTILPDNTCEVGLQFVTISKKNLKKLYQLIK
jgi:PilZ domain